MVEAIPDAGNRSAIAGDDSLIVLRQRIHRFLEEEIGVGSFPGASYIIGDSSGIRIQDALGHSVLKPAKILASIDTIYDVASLTKPLITATLIMRAASMGLFDLATSVSAFLSELGPDKRDLTFLDLLTHRGGFQAWYPLYSNGIGDRAYLEALVKRPLRYRPGTREIYSCLGFVLLHLTLKRVSGRKVEDLAREWIFDPLSLRDSHFSPQPSMKYRIAATEWGNSNERRMVAKRGLNFHRFRRYMIWGEVNDGNAYYMGGMAGNAGLFSTAHDVFRIAQAYLNGDSALLPAEMAGLSRRNFTPGLEENRGLGWQLPSPRPESPSVMLSEGSFGHTGFTGTSVWVDPERDLIMVLLTNRLHPSVQPLNMQSIRRKFHLLVCEQWDERRSS